ncbi:RadC family protein [Parahaliea mediterranea]|uniref:RadC family protein n=1 Tax=Parahaliea mediterranea TaxID=651086 RepID=UPI000E2E7D0B|nr:DNA repair protein RadC [Parahaliea mediterranea]
MAISDWGAGEGPRDKLLQRGPQSVSDAELLAVLLRTGRKGHSALDLARDLLGRFGGIRGVLTAQGEQLLDCPGMGESKLAQLQAAQELARRQVQEGLTEGNLMGNPQQTRLFLSHHLGGREREVFTCLFLDNQHRLLRCEDLFYGTLDGAAVYPREVAVRALQYRAAAVILAHNHPSGVAEPSSADRRITQRLQDALGLLDIRVLDHIIVGRGQSCSFAERGLL